MGTSPCSDHWALRLCSFSSQWVASYSYLCLKFSHLFSISSTLCCYKPHHIDLIPCQGLSPLESPLYPAASVPGRGQCSPMRVHGLFHLLLYSPHLLMLMSPIGSDFPQYGFIGLGVPNFQHSTTLRRHSGSVSKTEPHYAFPNTFSQHSTQCR